MIIDGNIVIFRGDDEEIVVSIKDEQSTAYTLQSGDFLTLTVKKTPTPEAEVLISTTSQTTTLIIPHTATADIPAGKYSFDIQLNKIQADGGYEIKTIYPDISTLPLGGARNWKNFIVTGEVTVDE